MGHRLDQGDLIDMLEESRMRHIPVRITLRDGRVFEDRVTDIGKWEGDPGSIRRRADQRWYPAQCRRLRQRFVDRRCYVFWSARWEGCCAISASYWLRKCQRFCTQYSLDL